MRFLKTTLSLAALLALLSVPARAADTYEVDPPHTQVIFRVSHFGMSNQWGRFNDTTGTVMFDEADPSKSSVQLVIKAESVDTANQKRDDHLRGPDFFNAKQFPTITFKSTKVKKAGDRQYDVTGEISLHGVTKIITVPFTLVGMGVDPKGMHRAGGEAELTIKRTDYRMNYGTNFLGDEVKLYLTIEGVKK